MKTKKYLLLLVLLFAMLFAFSVSGMGLVETGYANTHSVYNDRDFPTHWHTKQDSCLADVYYSFDHGLIYDSIDVQVYNTFMIYNHTVKVRVEAHMYYSGKEYSTTIENTTSGKARVNGKSFVTADSTYTTFKNTWDLGWITFIGTK